MAEAVPFLEKCYAGPYLASSAGPYVLAVLRPKTVGKVPSSSESARRHVAGSPAGGELCKSS